MGHIRATVPALLAGVGLTSERDPLCLAPVDETNQTWQRTLARWRGDRTRYDLSDLRRSAAHVSALGAALIGMDDLQLRQHAPSADTVAHIFAVVREVAHRALGLRHYLVLALKYS